MKKSVTNFLILCFLIGITSNLFSSIGQYKTETKKVIVQVKYISSHVAYELLRQYKSRDGKIQPISERNALIIEDFPEVVEKLLLFLKEIDVKPLDLQFTVDLILGSK